jgi:chromosome segregation protein
LYLKRLEIQGFKSLADKIELHFNPGVSVIVGPNGSGKSNIADAVRWVLGEQSAKSLRGAKMEDVIFAGSDKRKPVGMSEVSLTIDNSDLVFPLDYSEINIMRRVYRSGESEYLINKAPCRLRDIHELFMDTGIGREGYSVIGQGRIDEILSVKSEDRRTIIEEAAGIVKYKNRKQQAIKKLTDTEQNLVRISDIISELENQVGPLEEQSKKAQEHLDYKSQLDVLEVNVLVNSIEDQQEKLQDNLAKEESLNTELIESETKLRKHESNIEKEKLQAAKQEEEISCLQKEIYTTGSLIEKKEAEIMVAEERLKNIDSQRENFAGEILELKNKEFAEMALHSGDESALNSLRGTISREKEHLTGLEIQISEAETRLQDEQKSIDDKKADIIDLLNEMAGVRNSINSGEVEKQGYQRRIGQLDEQITDLEAQHQGSLLKEKEIRLQTKKTLGNIDMKKNNENNILLQKDDIEKRFEIACSEAVIIRETLQDRASRLKALQELQDGYEGYHRGVKEVLLESKKGEACSGICGVVAEIINVEDKYETALEVALGSALQFIVTETDNDARTAIEFLKKTKSGRATFLPLNTIKISPKDKALISAKTCRGFIGIASQLVKSDIKYSYIIEYLLGKVVIAEDIKHATEIARAVNQSLKIVTLDGDVISPGGSMTGGVYQKSKASLLGRLREIEELSIEKEKLEKEMNLFEENAYRICTLNKLRSKKIWMQLYLNWKELIPLIGCLKKKNSWRKRNGKTLNTVLVIINRNLKNYRIKMKNSGAL